MSSTRGVLIRHVSERLSDPAFSTFIHLIHSLATIDPKRNVEDTRVFARLLLEVEEKYRTLVLQQLSSSAALGVDGGEDEIHSDAFVQQLHDVGMVVVQDPKAELEDKVAGLELLRCMLRFDDTNASPRRLGCAAVLRDVLENKVLGGSVTSTYIDKTYDIPVLLLAARCLGDLSTFASTIPEMMNLRKRFLEPSVEWLVDGKYAVRRLGAVLILRALASRAPTLFYEVHHHLPKGFGTRTLASKQTVGGGPAYIWSVLLDKEKVEIREYGAEAYGAFIQLVHERESEDEHYREAIQYIDTNFDRAAGQITSPDLAGGAGSSGGSNSRLGILGGGGGGSGVGGSGSGGGGKGKCGEVEVVHAALLVLIQLLKHPGDFMRRELGYKKEKYWRHLGRVLSWRLHKDERVRHTVLDLIPMLAAFNIHWFVNGRFPSNSQSSVDDVSDSDRGKSFQDVCISHILNRIESVSTAGGGGSGGSGNSSFAGSPGMAPTMISHNQGQGSDRRSAYKALGALALAAGSSILKNAAVLGQTLEAIKEGFRLRPFCEEAVECLRMVVNATVKPHQAPPKSLERFFGFPGTVKDMFRGGISANLVRTLSVVSLKIPSSSAVIQQCVLTETRFTLEWFISRQQQGWGVGFGGVVGSSSGGSTSSSGGGGSGGEGSAAVGGSGSGSWVEDHDTAVALRGLAGGLSHASAVARSCEPRKDNDNLATSAISPSHVMALAQGNVFAQPGTFLASGNGSTAKGKERRPSMMTGMLDRFDQAGVGTASGGPLGQTPQTATRNNRVGSSIAPNQTPMPPPPPPSKSSFGSLFKGVVKAATASSSSASGTDHGNNTGGGGGGGGGVGSSASGGGGNEGSHRLALETSGNPVMSVAAALHTLANFNWEQPAVNNTTLSSQQQKQQQRQRAGTTTGVVGSSSGGGGGGSSGDSTRGYGWVEEVCDVVRCFVPRLLEDDSKQVRIAAAQCCCTVIDRLVAPRIALHKTPAAAAAAAAASSTASQKRNSSIIADGVGSHHSEAFKSAAEAELVTVMCSVLEQVVMVGVADSEVEVRFRLLSCLSPSSDSLLLRSPTTSLLLLAQTMHDEAFLVREAGMVVMARLAHRAPLSLMPQVRKCISNQLTLLELSGDDRVKEEAVNLLKCVAAGAGSLLQPYVPAIMHHMLEQLMDPSASPALVQATLAGVGELSLVSHNAVRPHLKELMPEIIRALKDRSVLNKTAIAMKALGQIIASTGDVITPYARYPELLDAILSALHFKESRGGEAAKRLQLEAVRTVGILGALSPDKLAGLRSTGELTMGVGDDDDDDDDIYDDGEDDDDGSEGGLRQKNKKKNKKSMMQKQHDEERRKQWQAATGEKAASSSSLGGAGGGGGASNQDDEQQAAQGGGGDDGTISDVLPAPAPGEIETLEEYYPRVSLNALVKLLRHSQEVKYAVKATHHICSHFDQPLLEVYLNHVMLGYIYAIGRPDLEDDNVDLLFDRLCDLIEMSLGGVALLKIMPTLVSLLDKSWARQLRECLKVVEAVEKVLGVFEFHHHAAPLLGLLLRTMKQDRSRDKSMTILVLGTLHKMAGRDVSENVVLPQLSLVLPDLMRVAEMSASSSSINNPSTQAISNSTGSVRPRVKALEVLRDLIDRISPTDLPDFASGIVLPLLRVVVSTSRNPSAGSNSAVGSSGGVASMGSSSSSASFDSSAAGGLPSPPSTTDPGSSSSAMGSSSSASAAAATAAAAAAALGDRETSELRNLSIRCLTKAAKRLGPSYRPYIAVAKQQLAPLKRLLAAQQFKISGGSHNSSYSLTSNSSNSEKIALMLENGGLDAFARCAALDNYEEMAAGVWHGRSVFEEGDIVEARYKGQPHKWVLAKVVKVGGAAATDSSAASGVPKGSRTYDIQFYPPDPLDVEVGVDKSFVRPPMLGNELRRRVKHSSGGSSAAIKTKEARASAAAARSKKAEWGAISREWQHGKFRRACECDKLTTAGDWTEWMRRVSVEILENSPCPYIQPCAAIAQVYEPLAYELFNAAFISVWNALYFDEDDKDLALEDIPVITAMENALKSPHLPPWILTLILNLAEFMEMQGAPLPIDITLLGGAALKSHAFAKCLHYKEMGFKGMQRLQRVDGNHDFRPPPTASTLAAAATSSLHALVGSTPTATAAAANAPQVIALEDCVEELISVNNHLNLPEAAAGVLEFSGVAQKPALLEKLGRWEKAKGMYDGILQRLEASSVQPPVKGDDDEESDDEGEGEDDEFDDVMDDLAEHIGGGIDFPAAGLGGNNKTRSSGAAPVTPEAVRYAKWRKQVAEARLGQLRCLHALGDFESQLTQSTSLLTFLTGTEGHVKGVGLGSPSSSSSSSLGGSQQQGRAWRVEARRLGADAACSLQAWDSLREDPLVKHAAARHKSVSATQQQQNLGASSSTVTSAVAGSEGSINSEEEHVQTLMYAAMLAVRDVNFDGAQRFIDDARHKVAPVLSGMLDEHYGRAYGTMVTVQQLAELEEIVRFRRKEDELRRLHTPALALKLMSHEKKRLQAKWRKRLHHLVAPDVDVWRRLVQVRSLVLPPQEDEGTWLRLAGLCRRSKRLALCENTLQRLHVTPNAPPAFVTGADGNVRLLAEAPETMDASSATSSTIAVRPSPHAAFALFDYMWEAAKASSSEQWRMDGALGRLSDFTSELLNQCQGSRAARARSRGSSGGVQMTTAATVAMMVGDDDDDDDDDDDEWIENENGEETKSPSSFLLDKHGQRSAVDKTLLVRSLLKVAEWKKHKALFSSTSGGTASSGNSNSGPAAVKGTVTALGEVLDLLGKAKDISRHMYRAWHSWALTNHEIVKLVQSEHSKRTQQRQQDDNNDCGDGASSLMSEEAVTVHITQAIGGFVKSIGLGGGNGSDIANVLQDTLRLLTLWFSYGHDSSVHAVVAAGIREVRAEVWLEVIPQLIARIDHHSPNVMTLLNDLLRRVAKAHPQALIYPMAVTSNTASEAGRRAATRIIHEMSGANQQLVDEANLVSREMMDVAITWHEYWFQGLEDAANMYFTDKDTEGMLTKLAELHDHWREQLQDQGYREEEEEEREEAATATASPVSETSEGGSASPVIATPATITNNNSAQPAPTATAAAVGTATIRVVSFIHAFGRDLKEAEEWVQLFKRTQDLAAINQAWDLYSSVFRRIKKQINNFESIELRHVSPKLLNARDLDLAVPGTYSHRSRVVRIKGFSPTVKVITSKQRPRFMTILGSDGKSYPFLLKGHEDLRQDERVMQLFRLINALLASDPSTAKSALHIRRYSVMPLSNNSGVIGWVPNCDTLQKLVKDYRDSRNVPMDLEKRLIWGMNVIEDDGNSRGGRVDYDKLDVMQKVEVFEEALAQTQGQDIGTMLWLRSPSSEVWLGRRTTFTRSLATMCMAGYILGLGDRHPSNLMLERTSGRVVHIDFGDCFEVAMERSKFPEKVPFRLTRMLVNAMEVSGIEGNYRSTCVNVMRVLRSKSDSLNAMLEAFVHDPLIGWKLLHANDGGDRETANLNPTSSDTGKATDEETGKRSLLHESTIEVNEQAIRVTRRIQLKLQGREFMGYPPEARYATTTAAASNLEQQLQLQSSGVGSSGAVMANDTAASGSVEVAVEEQVDRLIHQAQAHENLSQMFVGWCGFW